LVSATAPLICVFRSCISGQVLELGLHFVQIGEAESWDCACIAIAKRKMVRSTADATLIPRDRLGGFIEPL
jgi:hypothetical protein